MILISLAVLFSIVLAVQMQSYRGTQREIQVQHLDTVRQVQSLVTIFSLLKVAAPLPAMGEWAITPHMATTLMSLIRQHQPRFILEAGSGVSTLVMAYCLKEFGQGTLLSLEHEEKRAMETSRDLSAHGLQDVAAVAYAPLKNVTIHGKSWLWYDAAQVQSVGLIDMVLIDGPPGKVQRSARYPALPILFHLLSDQAIIVIDDGLRPEEKQIIALWRKEFPFFEYQTLRDGKSAVILRRKSRGIR